LRNQLRLFFIYVSHPELVSGSLFYSIKTKHRHKVSKTQRESKSKSLHRKTVKHAEKIKSIHRETREERKSRSKAFNHRAHRE